VQAKDEVEGENVQVRDEMRSVRERDTVNRVTRCSRLALFGIALQANKASADFAKFHVPV
jgi:hypothetical protein